MHTCAMVVIAYIMVIVVDSNVIFVTLWSSYMTQAFL